MKILTKARHLNQNMKQRFSDKTIPTMRRERNVVAEEFRAFRGIVANWAFLR